MRHNILGRLIVQLKDIMDHLFFIVIDHTALRADVNHHADFLFRDVVFFHIGVNTAQTKH